MKKWLAILTLLLFSSSTFAESPLSFHIYGISGKEKRNVEKRLALTTRDLKKDASFKEIQASFNKTPNNIKKALQPYGYFNSEVQAQLMRVGFDWVGEYHIQLGPRLSITHLDFKVTGPGKDNPILQEYIKHFPLAVGKPLNIPRYNKVKKALFQLAAEQGYIQAQLTTHEVKINLLNKTVDITLHFDTGEKYFYGPIHFNLTPFDPKFLQRFVHIKPDQVYTPSQVMLLENNLINSQFFQSVRVIPKIEDTKKKEVPIDIHLAPKKSQAYTIGVGYSTDIRLRGILGWEWRRITPTGHHLQAFVQASEKDSRIQADYIIPGSNPVTDEYHLSTAAFRICTPKGISIASQSAASYVTQWHDFEITAAMNALFDRSYQKPEAPSQTTQFIYPSLVLLSTVTDDFTDNHRGYMIKWVIQGASENVLSTQTFWQTRLDGKVIHSLNRNNRIVTRGTFGYTGTSNVATLPISLQFLTGGSQSVRGYTYQSLGPGRFLVVGSAEYERRIYGKWFGVTFFDFGNSVNSLGGKTPFFKQMKKSVGIGIMRETPVGPIQLSIAKALDSPGQPWSLVFNFGPEL